MKTLKKSVFLSTIIMSCYGISDVKAEWILEVEGEKAVPRVHVSAKIPGHSKDLVWTEVEGVVSRPTSISSKDRHSIFTLPDVPNNATLIVQLLDGERAQLGARFYRPQGSHNGFNSFTQPSWEDLQEGFRLQWRGNRVEKK